MISVATAEAFIQSNLKNIENELVPFDCSNGRILAENLLADRPFPPFDRVTMDGIAVAFNAQQKSWKIEGIAAAGSPQLSLENPENCIEVMTGAMLPSGCDTVIRYEDFLIVDGFATLQIERITQGQNVHLRASDRVQNSIIVAEGCKISAAEIGVMASIGKVEVLVKKRAKILVISTGDELVAVAEKPLEHQIRSSNGYALKAALESADASVDYIHLSDNQEIIEEKIKEDIRNFDALVLSGGVSAGKFDYVPNALENQGVEQVFHQVSQRPGKPFWFGKAANGVVVFALPGNPVSTFMCLHRYVLPWLAASLGQKQHFEKVVLGEDFHFKPPLTHFLQVKITFENGRKMAKPLPGNGSGDLANLTNADGFIELPSETDFFESGQLFSFISYR